MWSVIAIVVTLALIANTASAASTEFNSTNWNLVSGTMIPHGDGYLRAPPNVTDGLVSYWNPGTDVGSGNTLTDIWGVNDGTIYGATWNMTSGALEYNGTSDYVYIGADESLNITGEISIEMEIKKTLQSGEVGLLFKLSAIGVDRAGYEVSLTDGRIRSTFGVDTPQLYETITAPTPLNNDRNHIHIIRNGSDANIFTNGSSVVNTSSFGSSWNGKDTEITIGQRWGGNRFNGSVYTLRIYNTVLTNDQINETRDNYHATTSYMETNIIDAGAGQVWKHTAFTGTDAGANTTGLLQINGSHDNSSFSGWQDVNSTYDIGDNVTIGVDFQYRYASFRWYANTSYQPETDVIESVEFISFSSSTECVNDFTIDIISGQNTALLSTNTSFGIILPGSTINISNTFNLTNIGNNDATVEATFTTFNGSVYGFNSASGSIGGANFSMALTEQTLVSLNNIAAGTATGSSNNVVADAVTDIWKVRLDIPSGQATALYTGTVELTFSDVI